jgi:hypothetical protein
MSDDLERTGLERGPDQLAVAGRVLVEHLERSLLALAAPAPSRPVHGDGEHPRLAGLEGNSGVLGHAIILTYAG